MIYPQSCRKCGGTVEFRQGIPVGQGEIVRDADILQCLSCGWERTKIANMPESQPNDHPSGSRQWFPVGTHGGGPERTRWHRKFQWGKKP